MSIKNALSIFKSELGFFPPRVCARDIRGRLHCTEYVRRVHYLTVLTLAVILVFFFRYALIYTVSHFYDTKLM